jgi:hypothetical protein
VHPFISSFLSFASLRHQTMPLLAEDYNLAVLLDLRMEEYATAWAHLTNDTVDDEQAAELLANL